MRFLPKDLRSTVAYGWCAASPTTMPVNCSWCGRQFVVKSGIASCGLCDSPGGLSVEDVVRDTDDGETADG